MYADVLIQYGVKILDKTFTYKIPDKISTISPGINAINICKICSVRIANKTLK